MTEQSTTTQMKKSKLKFKMQAVLLGAVSLTLGDKAIAAAYSLTNGPGDGSVSVGVDGFGAFGSSIGADASNAVYDPVGGAPPAAGTTFESGVAIRMGSSGARTFLTSGAIGSSGGLTNPTVTGTTTSGSSSFSFGGLSFTLTQTLSPLFTGLTQTGTYLTQSYSITNPGAITLDFEMVRYLDGDLLFDGSLTDGGGRLFAGSTEVLFEIDSATGAGTATTFVGITAEGGTIPVAGRYEIDSFSGLRSRIISGTALDNTVTGDAGDADQFIDAGGGYDVTLALNNVFSLAPGASTTYTTTTIFGAGAPEDVRPPTVPEGGASMALLGLGLAGIGWYHRRLKKA
jgi:hypothetical protein